jgi:hypothetical protein
MGEAFMGEITGGYMVSVSKPQNERPIGRFRRRWKEDLTTANVHIM